MNKQELIERIEGLPYNKGLIVDTIKISRKGLLELVSQLDEPKKSKFRSLWRIGLRFVKKIWR